MNALKENNSDLRAKLREILGKDRVRRDSADLFCLPTALESICQYRN